MKLIKNDCIGGGINDSFVELYRLLAKNRISTIKISTAKKCVFMRAQGLFQNERSIEIFRFFFKIVVSHFFKHVENFITKNIKMQLFLQNP